MYLVLVVKIHDWLLLVLRPYCFMLSAKEIYAINIISLEIS